MKKEQNSKERLIKLADKMGITNLSKALRDPKVTAQCDDIKKYGWVRCITGNPSNEDNVLVTDGKSAWIGYYRFKKHFNDRAVGWFLTYPAPFETNEVIAWIFMPEVFELKDRGDVYSTLEDI